MGMFPLPWCPALGNSQGREAALSLSLCCESHPEEQRCSVQALSIPPSTLQEFQDPAALPILSPV